MGECRERMERDHKPYRDGSKAEVGLACKQRKIKVVLFIARLTSGGAERVFVNLASALGEHNFEVTLLVGTLQNAAYLEEIPDCVRISELGVAHMRSAIVKMALWLRRERPDVIISALNHSNIVAVLAAKLSGTGVRTVVTIHQTVSQYLRTTRSLYSRFITRVMLKCCAMANKIVVVSKGAAEDLVKLAKMSRSQITTIYNPIITPSLHCAMGYPVIHPWFKPNEPPVILGVGRLTAQKDFPTLLRAFVLVKKMQNVRLVILGDGEDRAALEALAAELNISDCVDLPGIEPNVYAFMSRAAVFVLSSIWEALPTVLVEAMACGCPVISTDCENGPREILQDGIYGRLIPVENPQQMADAILQTLRSPKRFLPPEALKPYEVDRVVDRYIDLIHEVVAA